MGFGCFELCLLLVLVGVGIGHGRFLRGEDAAEAESILRKLESFERDQQKPQNNTHQEFFDQLSQNEQEWILRLAISHESDQSDDQQETEMRLGRGIVARKPKPDEPVIPRVPEKVMDMMLNGDISKQFQERLIDWLKKDLGYTANDFKNFDMGSQEFCREGDGACMSLRNIGGICCPFG